MNEALSRASGKETGRKSGRGTGLASPYLGSGCRKSRFHCTASTQPAQCVFMLHFATIAGDIQ
eukprot:11787544-Prorocentrum_lima.AAC.1